MGRSLFLFFLITFANFEILEEICNADQEVGRGLKSQSVHVIFTPFLPFSEHVSVIPPPLLYQVYYFLLAVNANNRVIHFLYLFLLGFFTGRCEN